MVKFSLPVNLFHFTNNFVLYTGHSCDAFGSNLMFHPSVKGFGQIILFPYVIAAWPYIPGQTIGEALIATLTNRMSPIFQNTPDRPTTEVVTEAH